MYWTNLTRVIAPAPVFENNDLINLHARIDSDDEEDILTHYVAAATQAVEGPRGIGLALATQTWRQSLAGFPDDGIVIELGPVQTIQSITYIDLDGVQQTLSPADYVYDLDTAPLTILPAYGKTFPQARPQPGSVKVTFIAGYGDADDVPADLKQAILFMVSHYVENREAATEKNSRELPLAVESILSRYRVQSLG